MNGKSRFTPGHDPEDCEHLIADGLGVNGSFSVLAKDMRDAGMALTDRKRLSGVQRAGHALVRMIDETELWLMRRLGIARRTVDDGLLFDLPPTAQAGGQTMPGRSLLIPK
jgi:hypothetical protein